MDESERRRRDLIRQLAEMPDDDEPHPDWTLTEEEGRQLLAILHADKDEGKECVMGEDKLPGMLEEIALGRYADYGGKGDYRYSPEQRTAAATALALLRVAQEIANIEIFLQSWAEHQSGVDPEDDD